MNVFQNEGWQSTKQNVHLAQFELNEDDSPREAMRAAVEEVEWVLGLDDTGASVRGKSRKPPEYKTR